MPLERQMLAPHPIANASGFYQEIISDPGSPAESTDPYVEQVLDIGETQTEQTETTTLATTNAEEGAAGTPVIPEFNPLWLLLLVPLLLPLLFLPRKKHRHLLNHKIRKNNRFQIEESRFREKVVPEFVRRDQPLPDNSEFDELSFEEEPSESEQQQDTVATGNSDSSSLEDEIQSLRDQVAEARDQMTHLSRLLEEAEKREVPFR